MSTAGPSGPPRWVEHAAYAFVALGAVGAALMQPGHIVGDGVDLYGTFWFYWWIGHCIEAGLDPGFTDLMFSPLGKDIFAHTGNNFVDALVAQPFQALLGFPRYQPVFIGTVLFVNALAMRPLARRVLGGEGRGLSWAGFACVLLWMANPFVLFELMTGRLTQAFLWFLPLAFASFLAIETQAAEAGARWSSPRVLVPAALAGLWTGLQAWTYWFMGFFMAFGFAWLAVVMLAQRKAPRRRLLAGWTVAAVVALLTVLPGLLAMVDASGGGEVPGLSVSEASLWQRLWEKPPPLGNNVEATLHGSYLMETRGQPMLGHLTWGGGLLLALLAGRGRWRWFGLVVVAGGLSLGAVIPGGPDGQDLVLPHYMLLYNVLPFFDRLWFPYRLLVIVFLGASLLLGSLVARANQGRAGRWPWLLPLMLCMLNLAEQNRHLAWPLLHREFVPPAVYNHIGEEGGGLVELPIGLARISIAWQAVHGQPTFGGMAENASIFWPEGYRKRLKNSFIRSLKFVTRKPDQPLSYKENEKRALLAEGYRWVVLDRHLMDSDLHRWAYGGRDEERADAPFEAQRQITEALGPPVAVDGPLVVWDLVGGSIVPPALRPTEETLSTRTWPMDDMPAYEAHLRELGRFE